MFSTKEHRQEIHNSFIRTTRYRYLRDPITRRVPNYTEWELWINEKLRGKMVCGERFYNVNQFKKWALHRFSLNHIEKEQPQIVYLDFYAQRI